MTAAPPNLSAPYPGLRPFEREDYLLFFGREEQITGILAQLADHRFVALVGSSGCGKSSLIRAGLFPAVNDGFLMGSTNLRTLVIRPGRQPYNGLVRALSRLKKDALGDGHACSTDGQPLTDDEKQIFAILRRTDLGLVQAIEACGIPIGDGLLLVVDQFEELFAFRRAAMDRDSFATRDEAAAFVAMLLRSATADEAGRIRVVLAMRSDFIGDCEAFLGLPEQVSRSQFLVPRLDRWQMAEAITRPSEVEDGAFAPFHFEEGLVTRMINEAGDRLDQLPLLQHALMRTWKNAVARTVPGAPVMLTARDYTAVGGIEQALSQHADAAWMSIQDDAKLSAIARRLFLLLCDIAPDGQITRRRPRVGEVQAVTGASLDEIKKVVRVFQEDDRNFLVSPPIENLTPESYLDISHEALLRRWKRFAGEWLVQERADVSELRRLTEPAMLRKQGQEVGLISAQDLGRIGRWQKRVSLEWALRYVKKEEWDEAQAFIKDSQAQVANEEEKRKKDAKAKQFLYLSTGIILIGATITSVGFAINAIHSQRIASKAEYDARQAAAAAEIAKKAAQESEAKARVQQTKAETSEKKALASAKQAEEAGQASQEALTRSIARSGTNYGVDAIGALWDLAGLDAKSAAIRTKVLDTWLGSTSTASDALLNNGWALHAAVGLDPQMRDRAAAGAARVGDRMAEGMIRLIHVAPDQSPDLESNGPVPLAKLAAWMTPQDAAALAKRLLTTMEASDQPQLSSMFELGSALAGCLARISPEESAALATRGVEAIVKSLNAADQIPSDPNVPSDGRIQTNAGAVFASLAPLLTPESAGKLAKPFAEILSRPETDQDHQARAAGILKALAPRLTSKDAAAQVAPLVAAVVKANPNANPNFIIQGIYALVVRLEPKTAADCAGPLVDALANGKKLDFTQTSTLEVWESLAARMDPSQRAPFASRASAAIVKTLSNSSQADGSTLEEGLQTLAALAPLMPPDDAAKLATWAADLLIQVLDGVGRPAPSPPAPQAHGKRPQIATPPPEPMSLDLLFATAQALAPSMPPPAAEKLVRSIESIALTPSRMPAGFLQISNLALLPLIARLPPPVALSIAEPLANGFENAAGLTEEDLAAKALLMESLIARLGPGQSEALADRIAPELLKAIDESPPNRAKRLALLSQALASVASHAQPSTTARFAVQGAKLLTQKLQGALEERDVSNLDTLGGGLGTLSQLIPTARATRLVALSNFLLTTSPTDDGFLLPTDEEEFTNLAAMLDAGDLAEVLKWPFCVGEAQRIVLGDLEKKTGGKFDGDLWKFVAQAPKLGIKNVDTPAKRPDVQDAVNELAGLGGDAAKPAPAKVGAL